MNTRVKMVSGTANKGNISNAMTDMQYQKRSYETDLFVVCIAFHSAPHDKNIATGETSPAITIMTFITRKLSSPEKFHHRITFITR